METSPTMYFTRIATMAFWIYIHIWIRAAFAMSLSLIENRHMAGFNTGSSDSINVVVVTVKYKIFRHISKRQGKLNNAHYVETPSMIVYKYTVLYRIWIYGFGR